MNDEMQLPEEEAQGDEVVLEREKQAAKPMAVSASPAGEQPEVHAGETRSADPESADDVMAKKVVSHEAEDGAVLAESRRHTRRSFLVAAAGAGASYGLYRYLSTSANAELQPGLLRDAFRANASISRGLFRDDALTPTYPLSRAETLRVNGLYGLKRALLAESWRLQVVGMQDQERHPGYVKDVTAWEYRYSAAKDEEDAGHDTKTAPKADGAVGAAKGGGAPKAGGKTDGSKKETRDEPPMGGGNAPPSNGPMPAETTSAKSATMETMKRHDGEDDGAEDDNHLGRKPRGKEEAGESNSTLPKGTPGVLLQMPDIAKLPRHELVTQFKCIEGWSQIVHWAGVRMKDFLEVYPPAPIGGKDPKYVYMETPDGDYYVGYDMHVMRHPQTLLVTEMMGAPLTQFHGAPLRLHAPTKYGYKQIKRIALIAYTNDKPDDYWTKLGYDWYAGL